MSKPTYRIGVDIGGTFTDIVLLGPDGAVLTQKISSSVDNYARAIVEGLTELLRSSAIPPGAVEEIRHGTTVASNAILERKGARVGLITTKGFGKSDPRVKGDTAQARTANRRVEIGIVDSTLHFEGTLPATKPGTE